MTDSLINRRAETMGWLVSNTQRTMADFMVWQIPGGVGVCDSYSLMVLIRVATLEPFTSGPTEIQPISVRVRFDDRPATNWMTWKGRKMAGPLGQLLYWELTATPLEHGGPEFFERLKESQRMLLRFRAGPLKELDLEFSLNGFTQAYAAACERN